MSGSFWDGDIKIANVTRGRTNINEVSAGYFAVMGTALLAGRDFDERDTPSAPLVAVVSEAFARKFFDGDALGQTFALPWPGGGDRILTIVGIVQNQKYHSVREAFTPLVFLAASQAADQSLTRRLILHGVMPAGELLPAVRSALLEIDPRLSVRFATMQSQMIESMFRERLMARLCTLFGLVALALAVIGLYSVVSYTVARRRVEIGVRVALGAARHRIVAMMLADTGRTLVLGVIAGSIAALAGAGLVRNLLYELEPHDWSTLALAIAVLCSAGLVAAVLPARRAARIDPVQALRES